MSLVLGPVHHWLYNQIETIEDREKEIVAAFKEQYGANEVDKLVKQVRKEYGQLKRDAPLEELIGNSGIHPWLEGAITTVQTREAALVKELMMEFDDQELLVKVYKNNGKKIAKEADTSQGTNELESAFEALKNTLLQRMPCDRLSAVVHNKADQIVWRHDIKLHTEFWQKAGVDLDLMHQLYDNWIKGFVKAINPKIKHQRDISQEQYEDIFTI
ncbi:hypothetical protein Halha_1231 [Halobacteroides halobius DSM 5150]|uniref:Uncharacterized protein n=1 Tax=Halobacteroides halobius (strain ATCC 35273 / DSM 5150 / MD-1) TaxID=748449 RepID=L0KAQ6_HALHC|nr:hypothetical protein [Halobacteroides halobius]AGB41178.1 hypothetical protein Halha_1231 [Halobacteroides halobius DSM 5150]